MRIADNPIGNGITVWTEEDDSPELHVIATRIMPEWLELFARKNRDYGSGSAYELGVRGQYSDIHRKMIKLKRAMWDGEQLDFEDTDEIIKDLISHLFLTLHMFGLQREAEQAYVYNEDDAAVDAFFRMVGGDPETALKMSGVLTPPFRELVARRATDMINGVQDEIMAVRLKRGEDERIGLHKFKDFTIEVQGTLDEPSMRLLAGEDFAESDAAQHGVGVSAASDEAWGGEAKVGPSRIITETVDGRVAYFHEAYPGADREPLALVPKALIDRAQKDHHVLSKEQEAGLRTLADWADRS